MDEDFWNKSDKVEMEKLGEMWSIRNGPYGAEVTERVINALFLQCPPLLVVPPELREDVPLSSIEESRDCRQEKEKDPGSDQISSVVWSCLHAINRSVLLKAFSIAIVERVNSKR